MAALTLNAGIALALALPGSSPSRADEPKAQASQSAIVNKVTLALRITGLGRDGCEVEIKPGHAGCDFTPITKKVDQRGQVNLPGVEVKSTSADRDCLFAITVKESGQPAKTIKRGLRLNAPSAADKSVPEQTFMCLLRSPSLAARDDESKKIK